MISRENRYAQSPLLCQHLLLMLSLNSKREVPLPKQANLCLVWSRRVLLCHQTDPFHLFWFTYLPYFFSFRILGTALAVAVCYSVCKFTFCWLWSLPLILYIFPCLLLTCSIGSPVMAGYHCLASGWIRLAFWTAKSWKLISASKMRLCVFWRIWSFRPRQLQISQWPDLRGVRSFCSLTQLLHGGVVAAAQRGAALGEQSSWDVPLTSVFHKGRCPLATKPVSAPTTCMLGDTLGRSPSQASLPPPPPLPAQSPAAWHSNVVWDTWAQHTARTAQQGSSHARYPELNPRTVLSSLVSLLSPGTCLFSTIPRPLSCKVLQIPALWFHCQPLLS